MKVRYSGNVHIVCFIVVFNRSFLDLDKSFRIPKVAIFSVAVVISRQ